MTQLASRNLSLCGNLTVSDSVVILHLHYEEGLQYLSLKFLFPEFLKGGRFYVIASGWFILLEVGAVQGTKMNYYSNLLCLEFQIGIWKSLIS